MSKKISLKQFLMKTGKFDKVYDCISAIKSGKVTIDNKTITNPNYSFNPKKCLVKLQNEKLKPLPKLYFLLNKSAGYVCQKSKEEKTIYDLSKKLNIDKNSKSSLFAVGRLDKDTEGLMIMTNDGKLSNLISNPINEINKEYYAKLEKPINLNQIKEIENGIKINIENIDYKTKPAKIRLISEKELHITILEGRKRQIRKMFETIGNKVIYLRRVSIGGLQLRNLKSADIKPISREEIMEKLFQ